MVHLRYTSYDAMETDRTGDRGAVNAADLLVANFPSGHVWLPVSDETKKWVLHQIPRGIVSIREELLRLDLNRAPQYAFPLFPSPSLSHLSSTPTFSSLCFFYHPLASAFILHPQSSPSASHQMPLSSRQISLCGNDWLAACWLFSI